MPVEESDPSEDEVPGGPPAEAGAGQVVPSVVTVEDEIRALLRDDPSRLGDVFRGRDEGLTAQQIADRHNVSTPGFVYSYDAYIAAALEGRLSSSSWVLKATSSSLRSLCRRARGVVSADALALLQARLAQAESALGEGGGAESDSVEEASDSETLAVAGRTADVPGIYAFSYGWYLESPVDSVRGNTLIKVGRAENVGRRIADHRQAAIRTHMPEPLALVRVYSAHGQDLAEVEAKFHRLLSTAGHDNPRRTQVGRRGDVGREWFLTNEAFLDACADACGLKTEYIGGSDFTSTAP